MLKFLPKRWLQTCSDGCGPQWWPRRWRPLFFHDCCVEHDKNYRGGVMSQEQADDMFLKNMLVKAGHDRKRRSEAGALFAAVALHGHRFHPGGKNED